MTHEPIEVLEDDYIFPEGCSLEAVFLARALRREPGEMIQVVRHFPATNATEWMAREEAARNLVWELECALKHAYRLKRAVDRGVG